VGELISLADPEARERERVGGKAARLATALQAGHPVLPGLVVPADAAVRWVAAIEDVLETDGLGAARLAAATMPLPVDLIHELERVATLGPPLVARSSTVLDDDGRLAGAFASLSDVPADDAHVAVRSCWASLFSVDATGRFRQIDRRPRAAGMAVLFQSEIHPRAAGWARVLGDAVEIAAVPGPPGPLLLGWVRGARATIGGTAPPGEVLPIDQVSLEALVAMIRAAVSELGADRIEWAIVEGRPVILQLSAAGSVLPVQAAPARRPMTTVPRPLVSVARLLAGRTGPLADHLITPWVAAASVPVEPRQLDGPTLDLFEEAVRRAASLRATLEGATGIPSAMLEERLAARDVVALDGLEAVALDRGDVAFVLGALDHVASALVARGVIATSHDVWSLSPAAVREALAGRTVQPPTRAPSSRWDALVFNVTEQAGVAHAGVGVSGGRVVGRARRLEAERPTSMVGPRDILVVDRPLPILAPLLWRAAGLISGTGSVGAHLFEVARSLHVPAAVVDLPSTPGSTVLALDGVSGVVTLWEP
jgi:phosphohistidine swiveling domain-containing protein